MTTKTESLVGREAAILRRQRKGAEQTDWEVKELVTVTKETLSNVFAGSYVFDHQSWYMRESRSPNSGTNSLARLSWDPGDIENARKLRDQKRIEQTEMQRKADEKANWLKQPCPALAHRIVGRINSSDSDPCIRQLAKLEEHVLRQVAEALNA